MEELTVTSSQAGDIVQSPAISGFIEANTITSSLAEIRDSHIIPVFTKDNETAISHTEFIETALDVTREYFHEHKISAPVIRLSHPIKGRIPEARHKQAKDLLEHEKTLYYERMAFLIEMPDISREIGGNKLSLSIGGVKAYNLDNLYNKKGSAEHFKLFIGFQNKVCLNLCIWTDGVKEDVKVTGLDALGKSIYRLVCDYDAESQFTKMLEFTNQFITEHQFAQLIGKSKLYNYLPPAEKKALPEFQFLDYHINTIANDYYSNRSFCRESDGSINLWRLYNLFTGANRNSYIDKFIQRGLNASQFISNINHAVSAKENFWFID